MRCGGGSPAREGGHKMVVVPQREREPWGVAVSGGEGENERDKQRVRGSEGEKRSIKKEEEN